MKLLTCWEQKYFFLSAFADFNFDQATFKLFSSKNYSVSDLYHPPPREPASQMCNAPDSSPDSCRPCSRQPSQIKSFCLGTRAIICPALQFFSHTWRAFSSISMRSDPSRDLLNFNGPLSPQPLAPRLFSSTNAMFDLTSYQPKALRS